jgi:hypothetical protein
MRSRQARATASQVVLPAATAATISVAVSSFSAAAGFFRETGIGT